MIDSFLYIALPYVAVFICIVGSIYRIKKEPMTYSALSSQFLENNGLMWGSLPWHIGIIVILLAHILAFICPEFWQQTLANRAVLLFVEILGYGLSILCILGLLVLGIRRLTSPRIQAVTTVMDLVVLILLFVQVAAGLFIAVQYKWGALWCTGTTCQYLWSLLLLQPDMTYIQDLPHAVKTHIVGAWLLILIVPFSRLLHMFAVPLAYLIRPPQNVIWANPRRMEANSDIFVKEKTRRHFVLAAGAIIFGGALLIAGTFDKIFGFFFGPRLSRQEETELMNDKLKRLQLTAEQRSLEVERRQSKYIFIAPLAELDSSEGKYFIDFEMQPAIAFKGSDDLPLMISAKCTHLGCTVGNKRDSEGKILCPCHVSYFDVVTGQPNEGAPAKAPLPHIAWVLMNENDEILASRQVDGKTTGAVDAQTLKEAKVFIKREDA
ncbi:MAG: respiratory nitrate reductase subunit gamma [Candidatus Obscuribacterales bacterium]|nr:respiratory nitrate reductase subunit gamma [Candidatus Obscuribacterales bacterium]